jgi:hypothetical protein
MESDVWAGNFAQSRQHRPLSDDVEPDAETCRGPDQDVHTLIRQEPRHGEQAIAAWPGAKSVDIDGRRHERGLDSVGAPDSPADVLADRDVEVSPA